MNDKMHPVYSFNSFFCVEGGGGGSLLADYMLLISRPLPYTYMLYQY